MASKGHKVSEETRKKISETMKGHKVSEETRKKISLGNRNRKVSEETRKKISLGHIGKHLSDEHKQKISERNRNNRNRLGNHLSEKQKEERLWKKEERLKKISINNNIFKIEYIEKTFLKLGLLLLESEYISRVTPMRYRCLKCGYEGVKKLKSVVLNQDCPICARKKSNEKKKKIWQKYREIKMNMNLENQSNSYLLHENH